MYVPFYSFRLIVSMRTCFSFLANILSPIPQIQRHTELNTMPHSPLDWLGISAVLMASLSSVPKPGWLHVIWDPSALRRFCSPYAAACRHLHQSFPPSSFLFMEISTLGFPTYPLSPRHSGSKSSSLLYPFLSYLQ